MEPMFEALSRRLLVIGNSGSGKSTLAERLAIRTLQPVFDLDRIHWEPDGRKRDESVARRTVREIAARPSWIIEGVYGWLAEEALPQTTALIWTDLPWLECRAAILGRGPRRGMSKADLEALVSWAEEYWSRSTPSSARGHAGLFEGFRGAKLRLTSRIEADQFWMSISGHGFRR